MKTVFLFSFIFFSNLFSQSERLSNNFLDYSFAGIKIRMGESEFLTIYPTAKLIFDDDSKKQYQLNSEGFILDCLFVNNKLISGTVGLSGAPLDKIGGINFIINSLNTQFGITDTKIEVKDYGTTYQNEWISIDSSRVIFIQYEFNENGGLIFINQTLSIENVYLIGEYFESNNFNFKVIDFEYSKSISKDFLIETARGYFLIIKVELTNLDHSNQSLHANNFMVIKNTRGELYKYDLVFNPTYAANYNSKSSIYNREGFPPLIPITTYLVFEIPDVDNSYAFSIYDYDYENFSTVKLLPGN
ncbi:MAG: DUF4352 domain-containing protein [Ignavibacteriales bacterium]|nr:DUF4352 domain-containing protein [Ignavibacteriales bacterium]